MSVFPGEELGIRLLGNYRVLDLTEGGCLLCGKMLGDYGADVVKIEPPEGSASRKIGPFYHDSPDKKKVFSGSHSMLIREALR